jgi:hypothetical protein
MTRLAFRRLRAFAAGLADVPKAGRFLLFLRLQPDLGEPTDCGRPGRQVGLFSAPIIHLAEHLVLASYANGGSPTGCGSTASLFG